MDNPVAKALHDGLDRLRERGLTKRQLVDRRTGAVCAVGALVDATPAHDHSRRVAVDYGAFVLLDAVAAEQYPERATDSLHPKGSVVLFNNHPDTTLEDMERVFEKAIVKAYETL